MSAIDFITASRTPGSYSVWPAPSTMRISASGQTAASACDVTAGTAVVAALHDDAGNAVSFRPRDQLVRPMKLLLAK